MRGHKVITCEACPAVYDEVVLLLVKKIVFIKIILKEFAFVSDHERHEAVGKTDILVK